MFKLKFKKLHKDAKMPSRAYPTDSGMDVYSIEDYTLQPNEQHRFLLGIACQFPKTIRVEATVIDSDYYTYENLDLSMSALFWDKSSVGNKGVKVMGGVIDPLYTGEWCVMLKNHSDEPVHFSKGQKLCQVIMTPVFLCDAEEVDELSETERGVSGFGSSGTH